MKRLILMIWMLLLVGCVSSTKYKEALSEISNLKGNISQLETDLKEKEAARISLEREISQLKKEIENLKNEKEVLQQDNANLKYLLEAKRDELSRSITDLRANVTEKEQRIKDLEAKIEKLSHEKAKALEEKEKAIAELKGTYNSLVSELQEEIKKGEIAVTQLKDKLTLSMVEKILFDSGRADIKKEGKKVLDRVVEILKNVKDKQINIEGHTDNVPISPRLVQKFPTNWELSTARATNVVRYLQEKGINPELLSATGYAEYRPIDTNETEGGRAKNRRIEIVLVPLLSKAVEQ